jgi:hypothetical protein
MLIEYRLSSTPTIITIDREVNDALWHNFTAEFLDRQMNIMIDGQSFSQVGFIYVRKPGFLYICSQLAIRP